MMTLEELYDRDPNKWTREDVDRIVDELRAQRKSFALKEATEKGDKSSKVAVPKPAKAAKPVGQLSLEALGIIITKPTTTPDSTPIEPATDGVSSNE